MALSRWQAKAKRKWGRQAVRIDCDGQYALVRPCRELDVILCPTPEEAQKKKARPCGGGCLQSAHHVVDLGPQPKKKSLGSKTDGGHREG
jgi:hypothetical protein